jgi:hypothetical protein
VKRLFNIDRVLLGIIVVRVIEVAIFTIVVSLLGQPAVADQPTAAPTIPPQQPSLDDAVQGFADRMALDQRLRTLEQQIQTLLNTNERAVQTRTETFPKSWVSTKQTTTKYRHRRRPEIDGTALAGKTVNANSAARRKITEASGCPPSVPCVERGTAPFTAPTGTREYDEAGTEIK